MRTSDVLKGLGVVGAALTAYLLLEPRKGSQRRRKIATVGRDLYSGAGQELGRLGGEISRIGGGVGRGIGGLVDRVGEMTGLSSGRSSRSSSSSGSTGGRRRKSGSRSRAAHASTNGSTSRQHA